MPLLLHPDFPIVPRLRQNGINIQHHSTGRSLRVAIVNIMPQAETYEFLLLNRLAQCQELVEPLFFRVVNHRYGSSDAAHLARHYRSLPELTKVNPDAVLLTGAPVEHLASSEIHYYSEIMELMGHCRRNNLPLLGICWGGVAVASFLGVGSVVLHEKLSGVYCSENLKREHHLLSGCPGEFYCPQSRYASLNEDQAAGFEQNGQIVRLAAIPGHGTFLFESADGLLTGHLGHPEYMPERLLFEYQRDRLSNPAVRFHGFDPDHPIDNWSADAGRFFRNWLNRIAKKQTIVSPRFSVSSEELCKPASS